jgi:DNA processing protein
VSACEECLARRWLLERVGAHLERVRARIADLLILDDQALIAAVGGRDAERLSRERSAFGPSQARAMLGAGSAAGLEMICRHAEAYPHRLRDLQAPPAVLSVNGGLERLAGFCRGETVAIVGTRRPSGYGADAARTMARGLSAAGVTVISGMAYGIDSAAHEGALMAGGRTVAVLAGSGERARPVGRAKLLARLLGSGVALGEVGTGADRWRWVLQARNRIIAGLATVTVLIEGAERSGAMITVRHADRLGREIGVLPGQVGVPQAAGPNLLLAKARAGSGPVDPLGVAAVRDAQDVLDRIYGEGIVELTAQQVRAAATPAEAQLLSQIERGLSNVAMVEPAELAALTGLEIKGWVSRGAGGALTLRGG